MTVSHICTWGSRFPSHHSSLQSSMLPDTDHGYYALLHFSVLRLQCLSLVAPSSLWGSLSPPVFHRCLQCSGWALPSRPLRYRCLSLTFVSQKVMVFGSALQLEPCYGVVAPSYLLSAKTYLSSKTNSFFCSCGTLLQHIYSNLIQFTQFMFQQFHKFKLYIYYLNYIYYNLINKFNYM